MSRILANIVQPSSNLFTSASTPAPVILEEFQLFTRLPIEQWLAIFEAFIDLELTTPHNIVIDLTRLQGSRAEKPTRRIRSLRKTPTRLHICYEWQTWGLKKYKQVFDSSTILPLESAVYIAPGIDTLVLKLTQGQQRYLVPQLSNLRPNQVDSPTDIISIPPFENWATGRVFLYALKLRVPLKYW